MSGDCNHYIPHLFTEIQRLKVHISFCLLTPAECTMHFGAPVVPEEYRLNSGWLKGTCSNFSSDSPKPLMKSSNSTLVW